MEQTTRRSLAGQKLFFTNPGFAFLAALFCSTARSSPECWSFGFTEELCCDLRLGPQGNLNCWDGAFTFATCCVQAKPPVASPFGLALPQAEPAPRPTPPPPPAPQPGPPPQPPPTPAPQPVLTQPQAPVVAPQVRNAAEPAIHSSACWSGDFTPRACCDTRRGPRGMEACWMPPYTFDACCTCVVEGRTVQAAVLVVVILIVWVFLGSILLRPSREVGSCDQRVNPKGKKGKPKSLDEANGIADTRRTEKRIDLLDNAKFCLTCLVLYDHLMGPRVGRKREMFILFHTRAFCLISGITSQPRGRPSEQMLRSLLFRVVVPLIFQCVLIQPFVVSALVNFKLDSPRVIVDAAFGNLFGQTLHDPDFWFMFALIFWRLWGFVLSPLHPNARLFFAVAFAAISGYATLGEASDEPLVDVSSLSGVWFLNMAVALFPIYILGQVLPFDRLLTAVPHNSSTVVLGIVIFAGLFFLQRSAVGKAFMGDLPNCGWSQTAPMFCHDAEAALFWLRGLCRNLIETTKCFIFFLICPRSHSFLSSLGQRSMYPYLLHRVPITWLRGWLDHAPAHLHVLRDGACLVAPVVVTAFLASWPVARVFSAFYEPAWMEKLVVAQV